ncbi:glypican-6 [Cimex lectularius]|uniref:Glypican n=1 Tax=Cimex lectularius TaxID=79782 RepID=A0A8I6TDE6_CIMLE|nr:glypican-6 [Cimex lectularius]
MSCGKFLLFTVATACCLCSVLCETVNCDNVKYTLAEKGLGTDVPKDLNVDLFMVCGEGPCCSEGMQQLLGYHSKKLFSATLSQTLGNLSTLLNNRAQKFDVIFKEMMAKAKTDFHDMFKRTYGIIYEQNSYVFTDLFIELEKYYARGQVDLTETMDNFFSTLYQKMFTVLNAQYHFDNKYLECVTDKMRELKPFGDVPSKLTNQLKRSFVATRTFVQSLTLAGNIVNNIQNLAMTASCNRAVAKMTQCPACSGLKELKPCSNYCTNVMKGCLAYHSQFDTSWNLFITQLDRVIERLLGPFNIEMVVEPINLKISDAIMNFQENAQPVSQKVFSSCGKPVLGKRRRRRGTGEIQFETLKFDTDGKGKKQQVPVDGLEKVIKDTRSKIRETKNFWQKLPYHMCGTTVTQAQENCWNGEKNDKYSKPNVGDGMPNQVNNPEVMVDIHQPNSLVNEQIYALNAIANKLKTAYMGMDVEWIDTEETFGSGSGSGYGPDDEDSSDGGSGMFPHYPNSNVHPPTDHPVEPELPRINEEDNRLYPIPDAGKATYNRTSERSSASNNSVNKVLFAYIMPIVMIWIGNAFSELWQ